MSKHVVCACALFAAGWAFPAAASANWYSGDPYLAPTAWPQYTENRSNVNQELALTYDNFNWVPGGGGGVVDVVGGHFFSFGQLNGSVIGSAYWEIRTGMSNNVGGTLVASGAGAIAVYATSFTQGGSAVWGVSVDVPNFALPAGSYWFGLAIGTVTSDPNEAQWFVTSTVGANGIGGPLGDDVSIYYQDINNGGTVTWNYSDSATINPGLTGFDPSYWINEVPAPSGFALLALGAMAATRRRRG